MKTHYFVACCYLLHRVLPHISRLSLLFQCEDIDLSLIQPAVEAAIASIKMVRADDLQEFYSTIQNNLQECNITVTDTNKKQFRERVQHKFIDAVIDQIQQRLPELSAFTIFDPQNVPSQTEESGFSAVGK